MNKLKFINILIFILISHSVFCQNKYDEGIVVKIKDTTNIHQVIKQAFTKADLIIKDLPGDTIISHATEFKGLGYVIGRAEIKGNIVTITGVYGLKKIGFWGYTNMPDNYKQVVYFRGSKAWPILQKVAENIPGTISYIN